MPLEIIILSDMIQEDKCHTFITHTRDLNYNTNEPTCETDTEPQKQRTDWWLRRGGGGGGRLKSTDVSFYIESG